MDYNASRESLLVQHMSALRGLNNVWASRVSGLLVPFLGMNADDAAGALFTQLPGILQPFQMSSAQLGARFYDLRREQAMNALPGTAAKPPNFLRDVMDLNPERLTASTANRVGFLANSIKQAIETENLAVFENDFRRATSVMVAQPNREAINDFILEDDWAADKVRVASPDGCPFCQSMTGLIPMDDDDTEFHNHCNCVLDATFKDEIKFRQSFADKIEEEREQAIELIRSGEAGTKPLKIGSEEWTKSLKAELATNARDWRKDFEKKRGLTPEQRKTRREKTDAHVDAIANKAAAVARGEATWNRNELDIMSTWKVSPTQLAQPRTKPLGNNNKDILKAMEIVRGTRTAKLPDK